MIRKTDQWEESPMDIAEKTIPELQEMMVAGKLSSVRLVEEYLDHIMKNDAGGLCLNSVAELNPDALDIAKGLDRERTLLGPRGLLHGIPILLKDNIGTGDKMHTTAGANSLADNYSIKDSPLAARLRQAGAVILGKTNMTEFAHYMAANMKNGYSSRGGQVKSPYGETLDVSGSSSGSAVAVSCNFCAAAVGTETAGSIICPSLNNSIVGLKPTVGLISRSGIVPICTQDTAGPMGRTVTDCAVLLGAMAAEDPDDPATHCTGKLRYGDYTQFLDPHGLCGLRIGVNRIRCEAGIFPDDCEALFEQELEVLRKAGAILVDNDIPYTGLEDDILSQATLLYEFKGALNAYLARWGNSTCRNLGEIIAYNQAHAESCLQYGQDLLEAAEHATGGRLLEPEYWKAKREALCRGARLGIDAAMEEKQLDAMICACYSNLPPVTGYPAIAVPMGFSKTGLPIGLSFYASAFQEPMLLRAAYAYEQLTHHRLAPNAVQALTI